MKKLIVFAIAILGFSAISFGQAISKDLSVVASGTIIEGLTISGGSGGEGGLGGTPISLNFGSVYASDAGGDITINPNETGTRTTSLRTTGATNAAKFVITGPVGQSYSVTYPLEAIEVTNQTAGSTAKMNVTALTWSDQSKVIAGGSITAYLGGTLTLGANQEAGTYKSASFNVTIAYE